MGLVNHARNTTGTALTAMIASQTYCTERSYVQAGRSTPTSLRPRAPSRSKIQKSRPVTCTATL